MTSLFLDTSSNTLIISIVKNSKIIDIISLEEAREHSIYAVEKLKKIIENNNLTPDDIDKIFVVNGPGSFTGIRIGVTIAKTYAYALNKKIVPVSSLKMKILGYNNYDNYISIMKDKKDLSYLGIYDKNYNTLFEGLLTEADIKEKIENIKGKNKIVKFELDDSNRENIDIVSIINYYNNINEVNPHNVNPNYLKEVI